MTIVSRRVVYVMMLAAGCAGGGKALEQPTAPPSSTDSVQTLYHPNGMPRAAGRYVDGRRSGHWREWHLNGHLWLDGAYVDGRETGPWVEYHANGLVKFEGTYKHGLLDGEWKSYCETGKVHAEGRSVAGKLEGTIEVHKCSTGERSRYTYVGNRPHGLRTSYVGERLTSDVTYKDGVYDGESHWYDEDGTKHTNQTWANGLEVEESSDEK